MGNTVCICKIAGVWKHGDGGGCSWWNSHSYCYKTCTWLAWWPWRKMDLVLSCQMDRNHLLGQYERLGNMCLCFRAGKSTGEWGGWLEWSPRKQGEASERSEIQGLCGGTLRYSLVVHCTNHIELWHIGKAEPGACHKDPGSHFPWVWWFCSLSTVENRHKLEQSYL